MNTPKYTAIDYINFLIGAQTAYSCTEAEKVQPPSDKRIAHDAINRLLNRIEPSSLDLWLEAKKWLNFNQGVLVIDDTTLDKPYSRKIELVTSHWFGLHKRVVKGINLTTLLWCDGDKHIPIDYRLYDKKEDGLTKK